MRLVSRGKKKVEKTEGELRQEQLERAIKKVADDLEYIPNPTYILEVGIPVRIGKLRDAVVEQILFDGKGYLIDYTGYNHNYGNPIYTPHEKNAFKWVDVRRFAPKDTKQFYKPEELKLSYSQRSLGDLLNKYYSFGVDLEPEYQREHVWNLEDKVSLIDSIYNNVDIGKFVFVHLGYGGRYIYEVLDGKQRYRALLDFLEDRFQYRGKYFSDLCNRDQDHFDNYMISYAEIQNATLEQKLQYFVRLNTGGRIMDKEHLEKVKKMLEDQQMK